MITHSFFFKIRLSVFIISLLVIFFLLGAARFAFADTGTHSGLNTGDIVEIDSICYELTTFDSSISGSYTGVAVHSESGGQIRFMGYNGTYYIVEKWSYNIVTCSAVDPLDTDDDEDGYTENEGDCNDTDAFINPGATDICGDGIDNDCSGSDLTCVLDPLNVDDDLDGYTENDGDCDDSDSSIYPGANEIFDDGIDQDCDGYDSVTSASDVDDDEDGYTENDGDCNDSNSSIYPGAIETCGDGIDQDCNGSDLNCADDGSSSSIYDVSLPNDGNSDASKELGHDLENYSFSERLDKFFADMKTTAVFNLIGSPSGDIPRYGSSVITVNAGSYGSHEFDFATWAPGLAIMKGLFLICASWVSIKILVLKK